MTDIDTSEPPPAVRPLERHAQLEVDHFCDACGYNLHGQDVTRDPHLGVLVCRCPECGKFHPAGAGSTATSIWLSRLATLALFAWVLIVLCGIFWIGVGFAALQGGYVDQMSWNKDVTPDGKPVEWLNDKNYIKGTNIVVNQVVSVRTTVRPTNDKPQWWWEQGPYVLGCVLLGVGAGVLWVVILWHWPRHRYAYAMLLPLLCAGIVLFVVGIDDEYDHIRGWVVRTVLMIALFQAAMIALGLWIGRPLGRTVVRMLIPPRPRQFLAFLWYADGKKMPGPSTK